MSFWLQTNHGKGFKVNLGAEETPSPTQNPVMEELQNEYMEEMEVQATPFFGARSERQQGQWIPLQDIQDGHFVFLFPSDDWEIRNGKGHFWLV
jgi:hypothetical protein